MKLKRRRAIPRTEGSFQLQPLESRLLLSATPGSVLTPAHRQTLLNSMTLSAGLQSALQSKLSANDVAGFDQQLLDYTRTRGGKHFFFEPDEVGQYVSFINSNLNAADVISRANAVMSNLYPEQDSSQSFTVSVPSDISWNYTGYSSNPETIHTLNRHYHFVDLAMAYRLSGTGTYADKIIGQLADWSQENPPLANSNDWPQSTRSWWYLNTAVRGETWSWTYQLMLGTAKWSKEANTLLMVKMHEHGQYLYTVTPKPLTSNQALVHGQGLLYVSHLFPEFSAAETWQTHARDLVFRSTNEQVFADGSHFEQSPGYAALIAERLVETKHLDDIAGVTWPATQSQKLTRAIDALYQFLTPNGNTPAMGDTYRRAVSTLFLKSNLTQGVTSWPAARPRVRDAWLFGPNAVAPYLTRPITPALGPRPTTFALRDSGNYIMRSGSDANARQILFDAGTRGSGHGHFDLLNVELFGYGKPLIADPGLVRYDNSAQRKWAISTPAHNTISINGLNHGTLDGARRAGVIVDRWSVTNTAAQVTAHHFAYAHLAGRPVVGRSVWYDLDGTMLVVDWGESLQSQTFTTSFTIPGTSTSYDAASGRIQSTTSGGNVKIQSLLQSGQTANRETNRFTSSNAPPNEIDPATRYTVSQSGTFAVFATLITAYNGGTAPNVTAQLLGSPTPGSTFKIRLTTSGSQTRDVTFAPPNLQRPNASASSRGADSDLQFDSAGRLHLTYYDRTARNLKYTVRDTSGKWSIVETIDAERLVGGNPSLAIDGNGRVGIAYTAGNSGDLKYAFHNGTEWTIETVDSRGSTGHYPSLAFSRNNGPVISYYDKSKGDLRLASSSSAGWHIITVDSGSLGTKDVGRWSHLVLDPSRPTASKWAIAYEDTGAGRMRYAIQGAIGGGEQQANGYTLFTIDSTVTKLGGFTSLAFDPAGRATVAYYDSANTALKFARASGVTGTGLRFSSSFVDNSGAVGAYCTHFYDSKGKANIFYFDRSNQTARRARNLGSWTFSSLGPGGRELHASVSGNSIAYTNLNESIPSLDVLFT